MPLPQKEYLDLQDLSHRWKTDEKTITQYMAEGKLQALVWINYPAEAKFLVPGTSPALYECIGLIPAKGYMAIDAEDVQNLLYNGNVQIRSFKSIDQTRNYSVPSHFNAISIKSNSLNIHVAERDRFETKHQLNQ